MRALVLLAAFGAIAWYAAPGGTAPNRLPAIVFVSRHPIPGEPGAVPGLGPDQRAVATGGRLFVREPDGRVRELSTGLYDVADPQVAWDGRRVTFAGAPAVDSGWRIYVMPLGGGVPSPVTRTALAASRRFDDLDPCWIGTDEICFASTRYPLRSEYADVPVTNLFVTRKDASGWSRPLRITSERNGADEPAYDPRADRIVFARWWFNRYRPSRLGVTTVAREAWPPDSVNFWQAISIPAHGGAGRLVAGELGSRRGTMAYQPALLPNGDVIGVFALNLGLSPRPGPLGIQRLPRGESGHARRLAGASIPESAPSGYADALGVAAPGACAPAALPDGRVVFSYAPGGRGDYGLFVIDAMGRGAPRLLVDLPGTLELDAAPVVPRSSPRRSASRGAPVALADLPATVLDSLTARGTFTYRSLGLFGSHGPALRAVAGARIRFYAAPLLSPGETRDTVLLLREVPVRRDGSVEEAGLPADVPLFEQVVDSTGHVLRSAHGAAHVAGFNAGRPGGVSLCVGCHFGHSRNEPAPRKR